MTKTLSRFAFLPLLLLALASGPCSAQGPNPLPITGNLGTLAGTPEPDAYIQIALMNCTGGQPQITGYHGIVGTTAQYVADSNGQINGLVWPNDLITCSGVTGGTKYALTVYDTNSTPIGTTQCFAVLSTQGTWNINTQVAIACGGSPPPSPATGSYGNLNSSGFFSGNNGTFTGTLTAHASLDVPLAGGTMTGNLKTPSVIAGGPTIDIRYNGAACDWNGSTGTDDTAAVQTTANTANALYVATGQRVGVRIPGTCEVAGIVTVASGVNFVGPGTIVVPDQTHIGATVTNHPTLLFNNADSVGVEGLTINVITPCTGNNATCSAILWLPTGADSVAHKHVYIRNNTIVNADWGILIGYYGTGSGSLADVDISGNRVESPAGAYTNADGIHVAGKVTSVTIANNRIAYRNDAAIGLSSEDGGYVLSGVTVTGNVLKEDRVGIDCAGCTDTNITGNFSKATIAAPGTSNPAYREIYYNGYPFNVSVSGNYFENNGSSDGTTAKIDPQNYSGQVSWPPMNSTFAHNTIGGSPGIFYMRGNTVASNDITFLTSGGGEIVDYDGTDNVASANISIGTNTYMASGLMTFGLGCALYNNVSIAPQNPLPGSTITYTNLSCIGTQTFSTPGDLNVGSGNLVSTGSGFTSILPGSSAAFDFIARDPTHATNHLILDSSGNFNIPIGWIATAQYIKVGGGGTGGMRNAAGATVIPGAVDVPHGSSSTHIQMSDGSGTTNNCPKFSADGGLTDSGAPCGGGGGGGVASINTVTGAFTFTGAGVSCTSTTCTFSGTGSGVTSVALTTPSWLTVAGSPITSSGTLAVTATGAQTANRFLATPDGTTGAVGLRAIATGDLPTIIKATQFQTNTEFSNGTCTTALTVDPANGNKQKVTLTNADTCALTFTQPSAGTTTVQLKVIQSAVSTFNGGISGCKWPGGTVPTVTQTTGAVDMVSVYLDGVTAYCQIAQAFQ